MVRIDLILKAFRCSHTSLHSAEKLALGATPRSHQNRCRACYGRYASNKGGETTQHI